MYIYTIYIFIINVYIYIYSFMYIYIICHLYIYMYYLFHLYIYIYVCMYIYYLYLLYIILCVKFHVKKHQKNIFPLDNSVFFFSHLSRTKIAGWSCRGRNTPRAGARPSVRSCGAWGPKPRKPRRSRWEMKAVVQLSVSELLRVVNNGL